MYPRRRKSNFTAKCLNTFVAHWRSHFKHVCFYLFLWENRYFEGNVSLFVILNRNLKENKLEVKSIWHDRELAKVNRLRVNRQKKKQASTKENVRREININMYAWMYFTQTPSEKNKWLATWQTNRAATWRPFLSSKINNYSTNDHFSDIQTIPFFEVGPLVSLVQKNDKFIHSSWLQIKYVHPSLLVLLQRKPLLELEAY